MNNWGYKIQPPKRKKNRIQNGEKYTLYFPFLSSPPQPHPYTFASFQRKSYIRIFQHKTHLFLFSEFAIFQFDETGFPFKLARVHILLSNYPSCFFITVVAARTLTYCAQNFQETLVYIHIALQSH